LDQPDLLKAAVQRASETFKGAAEKASGRSVKPSSWNTSRKGYPLLKPELRKSHTRRNEAIQDIKNRVLQAIGLGTGQTSCSFNLSSG
jgi:hypothetical protein